MFSRVVWLAVILLVSFVLLLVVRPGQMAILESLLAYVLSPSQLVIARPVNGLADVVDDVNTIADLRRDNLTLKRQVDDLSRQAASVPALEREVQSLRDQLGLRRAQPQLQWIEARVILIDSSNLGRSIAINRGSGDGIQDGMTVITARGLVGRVVRVTPMWSRVLLITDVASSANGVVQGTRTRGIVSGQRLPDGDGLVMRNVTQGEKIQGGDTIVTSGLGGVFPAGIVIGRVSDVRQRDTDVSQEASIEPAVDMTRLDTVLVVINHVPIRLD